jgi:hypothetical protein
LSLRPREYSWLKNEDVLTQVAGQVFFINRALDRLLQRIPRENQLTLSYHELCESPGFCLERIAAVANRQGASVELQSEPPSFNYREYDADQFPEITAIKDKIEALKKRCLDESGRGNTDR